MSDPNTPDPVTIALGEPDPPPPTLREEFWWWFSGPAMARLGMGVLLVAGAVFLLAAAQRWPPHMQEMAYRALGSLFAVLVGWVAAPLFRLTHVPVDMATRKNGCLGVIAWQIWYGFMVIVLVAVIAVTDMKVWLLLGFMAGFMLRLVLPAVDDPARDPVRSAAPSWLVIGAGMLLAMAELAALGWALASGERDASLVWASIVVAIPPVVGFFLKSRAWPLLVLLSGVLSVLVASAWATPSGEAWPTGIPADPLPGLAFDKSLAVVFAGLLLAVAAIWTARALTLRHQQSAA